MASASNRGVRNVLAKLKRCVEEKNYYEAHQMYKTLYFRYVSREKYAEALDMLYDGAYTFLKHEQHHSGADLAQMYVETLHKAKAPPCAEIAERVTTLHALMKSDIPERTKFVNAALHWSVSVYPERKSGHPALREQFACTFWREKNYTLARYHFIHCDDGEGCAAMLVEYHITAGFPSEVDLFVAQAVLQYLCLRNKNTAELCFTCYTKHHPQIEDGPPFVRPLLNFLWLLLLAVEGGKLTVFTVLCEQYQPSIQRDPCYPEYLDKIGQVFFGLPPPKVEHGGMFDNLMQSLFGPDPDEVDIARIASSSSAHSIQQEEDLD